MKTIAGALAIVLLCCAILGVEVLAAQFELGEIAYFLILPIALAVYYVTRWMRGPGSELGTPVPSLNLSEHALDDDSSSKPPSRG